MVFLFFKTTNMSNNKFIFNFKSSTGYLNELKYLFENIVLPERNIKIGINNIENDKIEINYCILRIDTQILHVEGLKIYYGRLIKYILL